MMMMMTIAPSSFQQQQQLLQRHHHHRSRRSNQSMLRTLLMIILSMNLLGQESWTANAAEAATSSSFLSLWLRRANANHDRNDANSQRWFFSQQPRTTATAELSHRTLSSSTSNYLLTFNEDGMPETLPLFVLELYSTNGNLTDGAIQLIEYALNDFLRAELNAVYNNKNSKESLGNPIATINTTLFSQLPKILVNNNNNNTTRHKNRQRRQLQQQRVTGSQFQTLVNYTFTYQPSPVVTAVADTTRILMQQPQTLTYFISNLTALNTNPQQYPELALVYLAIRTETTDTAVLYNNKNGGNGNKGQGTTTTTTSRGSSGGSNNVVVIPTVAGSAAILIALIAVFALRRRKYSRRPHRLRDGNNNSIHNSDKDAPDLAYLDLESDLDYANSSSFDQSLPPPSTTPTSSNKSPSNYLNNRSYNYPSTPCSIMSPNGMDSTFEGLEDVMTSPCGGFAGSPLNSTTSPRCKSLLSGLSNASATTIKVSNVASTKKKSFFRRSGTTATTATTTTSDGGPAADATTTPKSTAEASSSLFTFLEDDDDDIVGGGGGEEDESKPSLQTSSDVSDDDDLQQQPTGMTAPTVVVLSNNQSRNAADDNNDKSPPRDSSPMFEFPPTWCNISSPGAAVLDDDDPAAAIASPEAVLADLQAIQQQQQQHARNPTTFSTPPPPTTSTPGDSSTRAIHGSALQHQHKRLLRSGGTSSSVSSPDSSTGSDHHNNSNMGTPLRRNPRDPDSTTGSTPLSRSSVEEEFLPYWDTGSPPTRHMSSSSPPTSSSSPLMAAASAAEIAVGRYYNPQRHRSQQRDNHTTTDDTTTSGEGGGNGSNSTTTTTGESEGESLRKNSSGGVAVAGAFPRWDQHHNNNNHPNSFAAATAVAIRDDDDEEDRGGTTTRKSDGTKSRRRAVDYRGTGDGSDMYQMSAMHPLDWSNKSADGMSVGDSTLSDSEEGGAAVARGVPRHFVMSPDHPNTTPAAAAAANAGSGVARRSKHNDRNTMNYHQHDTMTTPPSPSTNKSPASYNSRSSRYSTLSESGHTKESEGGGSSSQSASRQLINDLVWLEKKIAHVRNMSSSAAGDMITDDDDDDGQPSSTATTPRSLSYGPGMIVNTDSLSYMSGDANVSPSSNEYDEEEEEEEGGFNSRGGNVAKRLPAVAMQSITCRDCYAPPGKLQIVIHSTKDGPAIHTVKEGSHLEGRVFPGDLIIAVDNIDTRSHSAEEVMKMMIAKSGFERKITVLHYDE